MNLANALVGIRIHKESAVHKQAEEDFMCCSGRIQMKTRWLMLGL